MDTPTTLPAIRFNRWLPYWAVLQVDLRQTLRNWVYRGWVLASVLAAVGYLLYKLGVYREAGIIQPASILISDLLRWTVVGSVTLIVVLTAGAISGERGTMADSVLSRGISRYQYFLGKWHARLAVVLGTFLTLGFVTLAASFVFLHEDLTWHGSLVALLTVTALLIPVVTCGVTFSALFSSTVLGIAVSWVALYGTGFALAHLAPAQPTPDRFLQSLPYVLRGNYDLEGLGRLMGWSVLVSCGMALVGLGFFARRDV